VPSSGAFEIRISNLRAAVAATGVAGQPLNALVSLSLPIDRPQITVALPQRSLLSARGSAAINCQGSDLPSNVTFSNLIAAKTPVSSTRVTEGFATAFEARTQGTDTGTRFLIRVSGFPAGAQIFVPDYVAGSSALAPTRAGDLDGSPSSVGAYQPGSGTLVLGRVAAADANGNGGFVTPLPPGGPFRFETLQSVPLAGGSGYLVYEVLDAGAGSENAQIPVFLGVPPNVGPAIARQQLTLAPLAGSTAIPRFAELDPVQDCISLGDCEAIQPKMEVSVSPNPMRFTAPAGQNPSDPGSIGTRNVGSSNSFIVVSYRVEYGPGASGWLVLDPPGPSNGKRIFFNATNLAQGTYTANVTVDGGEAGKEVVPITLVITAPAPNPNPNPNPNPDPPTVARPLITRIVNGASREPAPVVSGSLYLIEGLNFSGASVGVTFEGLTARIIGSNANQISVQAPDLGARTAAQVVVTVDGTASAPSFVSAAYAWPAIFANGLLNGDNSANSASNGAAAGSVVQVFATGLPPSADRITAEVHDRRDLAPVYAGSTPGSGVQQVNVQVPGDLPAMTTYLSVCGTAPGGEKFCSPGVALTIR
jgi:uncharacterized protein (TIGR03437 family)